eukprot:TRINITY_DN11973_c0_g1_i1.p1 TRINITY_DN11973_c0_g1~~TRINITY_DN11973_c0_g1_i1.p1  ORF type:complete len:355 (-),score=41.06 TRINITY_DN11973_c0_g1_i1:114-1178(-)
MRLTTVFCLPVLIIAAKHSKRLGAQLVAEGACSFPIDVVYTWISQPSATEYQQIKKDCGGSLNGGMQRFRNLGNFRTSLRMLDQNMPWVRRIFVVTPNGTAPAWLNLQNPRIQVLNQNDLFPRKTDLPVQNSQQVEAHLQRIPGIAEHFIYFNDDMFAASPLQPDFFFSSDGKPIFRTKSHVPQPQADWRNLTEPGNLIGEHMPYPLTISMVSQMQEIWPDTFARISSAHCRGDIPTTMGPGWLYQWFGVQSNSSVVSRTGHFAWLNNLNVHQASAWYEEQLSNRPDLLCINDDFERENMERFEHQMTELRTFMNDLSGGKPSQFEIGAAVRMEMWWSLETILILAFVRATADA